jgi:glucose/arabinose dehydrogenase
MVRQPPDRTVHGLALLLAAAFVVPAMAQSEPLVGSAAFGDWRTDKPGVSRLIKPEDLPKPGATPSSANFSRGPRQVRVAPNGDIFVAETRAGRIRVLRAPDGAAKPLVNEIYASGLNRPFGIAFFPSGENPRWVYVANTDGVVRFAYHPGDIRAAENPETVVAQFAAWLRTLDPGHRLHQRQQADADIGWFREQ